MGVEYTRRPEPADPPAEPGATGGNEPIRYLRTRGTTPAGEAPGPPARAPQPAGGRGRGRRRLTIGVGVVLVAAVAVTAVSVLQRGTSSEVALPRTAGAHRAQLQEYLQGPGRPLLQLARTVPPDLAAAETDRCRSLTTQLVRVGQPAQLSRLPTAAPDQAVRDASLSLLAATARYLSGCAQARPVPAAREQTTFQVTILRRLLERNGIAA